MKLNVILNPFANRWNARRKLDAVHTALRAAALDYELTETRAAGDAARAARDAAADFDAIVAAGGDGTVNEVVNGLIAAAGEGPTRPLGILSLGTGNDFAAMTGLPRDPHQAAAVIAAGHTRAIDIGRLTFCETGTQEPDTAESSRAHAVGSVATVSHYFDNNCAVAMEPLVTIENTRIRRLSGNLRYVLALIRALRRLKAWHMRVTWDDESYEGPVHLLSVCNTPRCGGVFRMAPRALPDDGLFDFVFAPELSKLEVLRLIPRFFRGSHIHHPRITYGRARRITIESVPPTPIHADGEVLTESATRVEYELLPGRLTLLAPPTPM